MPELAPWRNDVKLSRMMIEDMMFDPILAAKILLDEKVPPHQELRLLTMWTTYFTSDDSGFSTGKSRNIATIAALRSVLFADRVSGIISKTFAQGQLIFKNFDRWALTNKRFRWALRKMKGEPRLIHGTMAWEAKFRGGAEIRVLPPDFARDAERLRSERWHDGYLDEWTVFGNFLALNKTIVGRVTNTNYYPDCPVRQNHIHLTSTANFMHHPSYQMIKYVQSMIAQGNKGYARFSCNYRHIPDTEEWKWLVSRKTIFHMQTTLPKNSVKTEVDGLWQKDSGTYYSSRIVEAARQSFIVPTLKRNESTEIFVGGFDVARGGANSNGNSATDDFAFSLFRMPHAGGTAVHAYSMRFNNITSAQMSGMIHAVQRSVGVSLWGYDPGGGGLFVKDELKKSIQLINGVPMQCTPITELFNPSGIPGYNILMPISRGDLIVKQLYPGMQSESVLINRFHKDFRDRLDTKQCMLAPRWKGWDGNGSMWDADSMRIWLIENYRSLSELDLVSAEMDLAISQLILVDIERDDNGIAVVDTHNMFKFGSKSKKDAAYGLVYAHLMTLAWDLLLKIGFQPQGTRSPTSGVVYASSPI